MTRRLFAILGPVLLIGSLLLMGGLGLWKMALEQDVRYEAFEAKLEQQERTYGRQRYSPYSGKTFSAASGLKAVNSLCASYLPVLGVMAVLGATLTLAFTLGPTKLLAIGRRPVRAIAWLLIVGGSIAAAAGVGGIVVLRHESWAAANRDRADLESRTVRGVPSPYGGRMTVVYGPGGNEETAQADGDKHAADVRVMLYGGVVGLLVGILIYFLDPGERTSPQPLGRRGNDADLTDSRRSSSRR